MPRIAGLALVVFTLGCWMASSSALAAPKPAFIWSVSAVQSPVSEGGGSAIFTITRSKPGSPATIDYATLGDSATAPSDYTATSGTLQFKSNQTSKTVTVPLVDDSDIEDRFETFGLLIGSPSKGAVGTFAAAQDIGDDDGTVSLTTANWAPTSISQTDFSNGQALDFQVTNSGTRAALVDVAGNTGGYALGGVSDGCTDDGDNFDCPDVAVPAGGSTTLQLTIMIPACDANDITVTLNGLSDALFGNLNSSPDLSHTYSRTLNPTACP